MNQRFSKLPLLCLGLILLLQVGVTQAFGATMPSPTIISLNYTLASGQSYILDTDDGKVSLSSAATPQAKPLGPFFVHPKVLADLNRWFKDYALATWRDFPSQKPQGSKTKSSNTSVKLRIALEQEPQLFISADLANPKDLPPNFLKAMQALQSILEQALGSDAQTKDLSIPKDTLHYLSWTLSGMRKDQRYEVYWRLDPNGLNPRVRRTQGRTVLDCALPKLKLLHLNELLASHKIKNWQGFQSKSSRALDGDSFRLKVVLASNQTVEASGTLRFPKGYTEARLAILGYLDTILGQ